MVRNGLGAGGDGGGEAVDEVDLAAAEEEPVDELEDQVPGVVHVRPGVRGGRRPTDEGRGGGRENTCRCIFLWSTGKEMGEGGGVSVCVPLRGGDMREGEYNPTGAHSSRTKIGKTIYSSSKIPLPPPA